MFEKEYNGYRKYRARCCDRRYKAVTLSLSVPECLGTENAWLTDGHCKAPVTKKSAIIAAEHMGSMVKVLPVDSENPGCDFFLGKCPGKLQSNADRQLSGQ